MVKLADGKERRIQYIASTTYWSPEGKPISAAEFMRRLFGDLSKIIADEDELRTIWSNPVNRVAFLERLADSGYDRDRLHDIRRLVDASDSDLFDVLSYVLFEAAMQTRRERAHKTELPDENQELRALLADILQAHVENGESELRLSKLEHFLTARYGRVSESKAKVGSIGAVREAFETMQARLYGS